MTNTEQGILFSVPSTKEKKVYPLEVAEKDFNERVKDKSNHPVFLIKDTSVNLYFVKQWGLRSAIESYKNFKIIKSTETFKN